MIRNKEIKILDYHGTVGEASDDALSDGDRGKLKGTQAADEGSRDRGDGELERPREYRRPRQAPRLLRLFPDLGEQPAHDRPATTVEGQLSPHLPLYASRGWFTEAVVTCSPVACGRAFAVPLEAAKLSSRASKTPLHWRKRL
ncbi:hypothetical protein BHE74_00007510 [Ensete ventricosum]|nr:hypothetical protein BHE74_00007510 [Ensete ventricosum]